MRDGSIPRPSSRQRGYDSRWDKARAAFLKAHPKCERCRRLGQDADAVHVDHIIPHRLAEARTPEAVVAARRLFWDKNNWQPLCVDHHVSTKQKEERSGGGMIGCTPDGRPIDPNHPWNRAR